MNNVSLKQKIYVGFAILICLTVLCGVVALIALKRFRESVQVMQAASETSERVLKIDRDIQELRLRVDRYVHLGHDSVRKNAEDSFHQLLHIVEESSEITDDSQVAESFQRIHQLVEASQAQFAKVVEERRVREGLVQESLPEMGDKIEIAFASLAEQLAGEPTQFDQRLTVSLAESEFAKAQKSLLRYFENPDSELVTEALQSLKQVARLLGETQNARDVLPNQMLQQYERTGLRAVQATRSYLFLNNVMMSADMAEMSYNCQQLRDLADQLTQNSEASLAQTSHLANQLASFAMIFAVVASAVIASRLSLQIVPPIEDLTDAFAQLATGVALEEIPATDRKDEIGQMATAAQVFSLQNQETNRLLEESQTLSKSLEQQSRKLELTNQELDHFAYVASHDLKSPLRGIRQLATWITEDCADQLNDVGLDYLDKLKLRVEKMESLLQDLLNFSRIGRIAPEQEMVDVNEMLSGLVDLVDNPHQIEITWSDEMPRFKTLRPPLEQVFMNLIGNAIKHNDKADEGKVEIHWHPHQDFHLFSVRDNGPGIDPKYHNRIFQMYQRVGDPRIDGSGMGLAIIKKQVESLGGSVKVDSDVGRGACFAFSWPIHADVVAENESDDSSEDQL